MPTNNPKTEHKEFDAQRMLVAYMTTKSWREVPHVSYVYEPDVTDFYEEYKKLKSDVKITLNTIMLKVVAEGLKAAPEMNAHLKYDEKTKEGRIILHEHVNISVPWQMPGGAMLPLTIDKADELSLSGIAACTNQLAEKVKNTDLNELIRIIAGVKPKPAQPGSGLSEEDISGATVTVSNIGSLYREQKGRLALLDIIPPQVFVAGIGAMQEVPGVYTDENGQKQIGIRKTLPICLVFDHRAADFGALVPFLKRLDEIFAAPEVIHTW